MGLNAKASESKSFTPAPEGLHPAVCWAVVDLGIQQKGGMYPGEQHQVYLGFELLDTEIEFERDGVKKTGPMRVGITVTLSLGEKAKLRKMLEKWRARPFTPEELDGFDISKLVGQACQVLVTHSVKGDKTYANVEAVLSWAKGTAKPAAPAETLYFSFEDHDFAAMQAAMPPWLAERIGKRLADSWSDFNAKQGGKATPVAEAQVEFSDDIPF